MAQARSTPPDPEVAAALDGGAMVLTSTARAARALRRDHSEAQRERGLTAWASPAIRDWPGWVSELWDLWEQHALRTDVPLVLTAMQEHALWLRVQQLAGQVVAPDRLAELAAEAYRLVGSYGAHSERRVLWASHEDAGRFAQWADSFDQQCRRNRWLSASRREEQLTSAIREGLLTTPGEMLLTGFDRVTPAQQALLDACTSRGMIIRAAPEVVPTAPRIMVAAHPREELDACVEWTRAELARRPGMRLGILVPALGRVRADLERALTRVLTPRGGAPLWEFSLGTPLAHAPVVRAALLLLHWTARPLSPTEAHWLLGSGFLAPTAADADALGRLAEFERSLVPGVALNRILDQRRLPQAVRRGLQDLQSYARVNQFASAERSFSAWADLAQAALGASRWPGYREASSRQFQAQQRLEHLLDELALLAFDGSRVRWSEFLATLELHAQATLFTLESRDAPVQIMGAFEGSGLHFDALWFLGVDDAQWPATGRPHPLLPMWLQRAHGMPHAEPEADWRLGLEVTARVAASAPEVTISYAREDKGIARRPSPLIAAVFPDAAADTVRPAVIRVTAARLEQVDDDSGMIPWPSDLVAGGAETLRRQAACAFQSFARKRLQLSSDRDDRDDLLGLDPMERGSLLHKVLERLWSPEAGDAVRLHSLDDLHRAIEDGSVPDMVTQHIDEAIALQLASDSTRDSWSAAYIDVEKARLKRLLLEWLNCEAAREPFTVTDVERELNNVEVHGLRFNLRVDRIDQLQNGTRLLLDYKTGKVSAAKWSGERPDEPQLPLYSTYGGLADVAGIAFAQLQVGGFELIACTEQPEAVLSHSRTATPLTSVERQGWSEALASLARAFLRGEAIVNPKQKAKTCEYCGLQGLCRVQEVEELQAAMLDEDDQD